MEFYQKYMSLSPIAYGKKTDFYMASLLKGKSTAFFIKLWICNLISYLIISSS